jgi:hypothetical protein
MCKRANERVFDERGVDVCGASRHSLGGATVAARWQAIGQCLGQCVDEESRSPRYLDGPLRLLRSFEPDVSTFGYTPAP